MSNIKWLAPVVCWFGNSVNAKNCLIRPAIEFNEPDTFYSEEWKVEKYDRNAAFRISRDKYGNPSYGGSVNDASVIRYLQELKSRKINIMFYPMLFLDVSKKPWRGRLTCSPDYIKSFFRKDEGYNRFILHYARLVKDYVDAFVIGSELVGLTSISDVDNNNKFPAVDELIALAKSVKQTVGLKVKVIYAADWSEYHHTEGGWYNLDPLWASPDIDVIGIDAYFPLTEDLEPKETTEELIKKGWESGEGWDYYWDSDRKKKYYFKDSDSDNQSNNDKYKYAWKNLEYWWKKKHKNPDGKITPWQPKMKPIWFTEFGFPSVDGCSNQPNVFYDPDSIESFFPRKSQGIVSFMAQRNALNATIEYLDQRNNKSGNKDLVERRFVWTWDARAYPAWPHLNVWSDGNLWKTGHWLNGKLGISSLASIIAGLLTEAGLKAKDYDVTRLIDHVQGYVINQHITVREAIEQLRAAFFFDVVESDGVLKFIPRNDNAVGNTGNKARNSKRTKTAKLNETNNETKIHENELVPLSGNSSSSSGSSSKSGVNSDMAETMQITIKQEMELPQKVTVSYLNKGASYDPLVSSASRQSVNTKEQINIELPIVLASWKAEKIADITLYNHWQERISYVLMLPPKYAYLESGDVITVKTNSKSNCNSSKDISNAKNKNKNSYASHTMRITKLEMERTGLIKIEASSFNSAIYESCNSLSAKSEYDKVIESIPKPMADTVIELLDLPLLPSDESNNNVSSPILRFAIYPNGSNWQGANIYASDNNGYDYSLVTQVPKSSSSTAGICNSSLGSHIAETFDYDNKITVTLHSYSNELKSIDELSLLNGGNLALIGDELVQFQKAELLSANQIEDTTVRKYVLSKLLRGKQGTEWAIATHKENERFILIDSNIIGTNVSNNLIGRELSYKAVSTQSTLEETKKQYKFKYSGNNLKPFAPVHIKHSKDIKGNVAFSWVRRSRTDNSWRDCVDVSIGEEFEKYQIDIKANTANKTNTQATDTTLLRTIETDKSEAIYSKEQQQQDFKQNNIKPNKITATIYQLSTQIGRGHKAAVTVEI